MSSNPKLCAVLADAVLLVHFAFVAFIVLGFLVIWLGYFLRWRFVRHRIFRGAHLLAMGYVLAEALLGITCPLTIWEHDLRRLAGQAVATGESFMQHWVHRLMFFNLSEQTFTLLYGAVFILIVATFWVVRPEWRRAKVAETARARA